MARRTTKSTTGTKASTKCACACAVVILCCTLSATAESASGSGSDSTPLLSRSDPQSQSQRFDTVPVLLGDRNRVVHSFDEQAFFDNAVVGRDQGIVGSRSRSSGESSESNHGASGSTGSSTRRSLLSNSNSSSSESVGSGNSGTSPSSNSSIGGVDRQQKIRGRYGHSAVYLPKRDQVLFIGGQVGTQGTYITNDVLSLNLSAPYFSHSSSIANGTDLSNHTIFSSGNSDVLFESQNANPRQETNLTSDLPPNAWAASAVDDQERVWLIGGVTQDCQNDAAAYVLEDTLDEEEVNRYSARSWRAISPARRPPRRRQARAVSVPQNGTAVNSGDGIYVFGGIAEPYTCSLETVGYLAMDDWQAWSNGTVVGTSPWEAPDGYGEPPVSDYAAVQLGETDGIVYLGGQTASGKLVEMDSLLLYNTTTGLYSSQVGCTLHLESGSVETDERVTNSHSLATFPPREWVTQLYRYQTDVSSSTAVYPTTPTLLLLFTSWIHPLRLGPGVLLRSPILALAVLPSPGILPHSHVMASLWSHTD